jgi:hypothetical protein
MSVIIKATAPTSYQLNSLSSFGMGYKKNMGGSFSASMEFDSEEEAKQYLRNRAEKYNDENPCGTEERLNNMYSDIEHGALTLDAVTAYVEEVEAENE